MTTDDGANCRGSMTQNKMSRQNCYLAPVDLEIKQVFEISANIQCYAIKWQVNFWPTKLIYLIKFCWWSRSSYFIGGCSLGWPSERLKSGPGVMLGTCS